MNVWTESLLAHLQLFRKVDPVIPTAPAWHAVLDLARFVSSPLSLARYKQRKYGDVYCVRALDGRKMITMLGPDAAEFVLMDRDKAFSARQAWMASPMGLYFSNGLLVMDPPEHIKHRRVMQMAFTSQALERHLAMMSPVIEQSVEHLLPANRRSATVKVFPAIKKMALTFAAKVFLGEDLGPKTEALNKAFLDTVEASGPLNLLAHVPLPFTLAAKGRKARRILEDYFYSKIAEKRRGSGDDFFSLMCHAETSEGERFTDREIVDHMIFLMMAAHDTSTITITTMAYHLAKHPEWQERLRAEVQALPDTHPTLEQLHGLHDTELVMKEALRLQPPLSVYPRMATKDVQYKGFTIRKGNMVILVPAYTHRMPEYWSNPDSFDPERFTPERAEDKRHRFAWMPFGGGIHKCLGMHFGPIEIKTVYVHLLRRYRWSVKPNYRIRYNNISLGKPWDGLPVRMERL